MSLHDNDHLMRGIVGKTVASAHIDEDGDFYLSFTDGSTLHGHPWGSYADDVGLDLDTETIGPEHGPEIPPGLPSEFDLALMAAYKPVIAHMMAEPMWPQLDRTGGKVTFNFIRSKE